MIEILALLTVLGAIVFGVLSVAWREESPLAARMATIRGERPFMDVAKGPESITVRLLGPMASSLAGKVENLLPTTWLRGIERGLIQAGQPVSLKGFLVGVAIVESLIGVFIFVMIAAMGGASGKGLIIIGAMGGIGLYMPKMWLSNRVRHRQKEILKSLPDAFDLITTCVEAGLGLEAALQKVSEKVPGPFGEELAICLREVSLGKLRREALKELAERTGVADLTTFINAVIQAESMGTSIAAVLRVQAEQMRMKRRQRAEQQAHQAPVKMTFPLVLCIFPTLFIVILGPAGITLYRELIAGG